MNTPAQQAASALLFGMANYVPRRPDSRFMLNSTTGEMVTYNELVQRFEEMTK